MESLLRRLARIAWFKPSWPWCLRAALSHCPALELQAKPWLEGWVSEEGWLGFSQRCSTGIWSRVWGAGEGSLLSHCRFGFWGSPVQPTELVHCCLQLSWKMHSGLSAQALEKGLALVRHFPWKVEREWFTPKYSSRCNPQDFSEKHWNVFPKNVSLFE